MSSTTHDFHICLDHLSTLRRALADLETTLGASHAHHWPTIDPTLHTGPAAWRVEKNDTATYVYGLLNEASPLGDTHADVVRRLEDWYHRIHEMVTAMTTYADRTRERYSAADEAVAAAAMRVAESEGRRCDFSRTYGLGGADRFGSGDAGAGAAGAGMGAGAP